MVQNIGIFQADGWVHDEDKRDNCIKASSHISENPST